MVGVSSLFLRQVSTDHHCSLQNCWPRNQHPSNGNESPMFTSLPLSPLLDVTTKAEGVWSKWRLSFSLTQAKLGCCAEGQALCLEQNPDVHRSELGSGDEWWKHFTWEGKSSWGYFSVSPADTSMFSLSCSQAENGSEMSVLVWIVMSSAGSLCTEHWLHSVGVGTCPGTYIHGRIIQKMQKRMIKTFTWMKKQCFHPPPFLVFSLHVLVVKLYLVFCKASDFNWCSSGNTFGCWGPHSHSPQFCCPRARQVSRWVVWQVWHAFLQGGR